MRVYTKVLFLLMSVISVKASAQHGKLSADKIGSLVRNHVSASYNPDTALLKKACGKSCIFIKFNVNKKGRIERLSFSKDSSLFIKSALTKAVLSIEQNKQLISYLSASGKTFVLPFIYFYQDGCKLPKLYPPAKTKEEGTDALIEYYEKASAMDHLGESVVKGLNFANGSLSAVDCILIAPLWVMTGSIE